ncbi:uncharacterized protein C21orf58 isoform X2 [Conger conger]|uniref:uncharacterized protein C21orf58 isoform X2 n=1 Tax=Conger conger TaxID=82655 RepID=UPI002A5AD951|nr:uncharacterized protein C21orf58 isoform X2 [Conger conger]
MADPVLDQMTRLKLRLLEKRLENERENLDDRAGTALSTRSVDGLEDALHSALRRKRDLLQRLRDQQLLEDSGRPHTWGGTHRRNRQDTRPVPQPIHIYQPAPLPTTLPAPLPPLPAPAPAPPRIIQHTMPQQPATIIQQLPQQQPLIAQIPPPQPLQPAKSGSIKEDMVELMLMQNAQMHQIIMHNMMLKAIPPMALSPPGGASQPNSTLHPATAQGQGNYSGAPMTLYSGKPRASSVHHHHHYGSAGPQLPPIGYQGWPPMMSTVSPGPAGAYHSTVQHAPGPITLPPLNVYGRV